MKMNSVRMTIAALAAATLLCGCGRPKPSWTERREPTTDAERKAVAEHVERILSATPTTLSGRDQDWDDAIAEAHQQARISLCRPTLWEWQGNGFLEGGGEYTGRWKYAEEAK